ncbi:hypothetical protein [Pseudomonas sp. nanlin1]|uniref:hypothetical protein n=1 Tax=Pseudomonas sp. nanlin1 TaxID=3040605 RepID=UPI00388DD31F
MITLNNSISHLPTSTLSNKVGATRVSSDIAEESATATAEDAQISSSAIVLSSLYAVASDYIKNEHLTAYSGAVNGNVTPGAYIDVGKYNDYLFEKAAMTMVVAAKEKGLDLAKEDVLAQLKDEHSDIASIRLDEANRQKKLGGDNVYSDLTTADLDNFTKAFIAAKENDLDINEVEGLALQRGIQNRCGSTLQAGDLYPYDWDFSETDPEKIAAAKNIMPESIILKAEELRAKLQGDLGLGRDFIEFLLNPRIGLRGATDDSLTFLSKLADIYNSK